MARGPRVFVSMEDPNKLVNVDHVAKIKVGPPNLDGTVPVSLTTDDPSTSSSFAFATLAATSSSFAFATLAATSSSFAFATLADATAEAMLWQSRIDNAG